MTSTSIISIIVIILAVILLDILCDDVRNTRQTGSLQNRENSRQKSAEILSEEKSPTPLPTLGRRRTQNPTLNGNIQQPSSSTPGTKKWIQQNNLWIRSEQAASGGNVAPINVNSNRPGIRGTGRPNLGVGNANLGAAGQNNRQQGLGENQESLGGNRQHSGGQQENVGTSNANNRQITRGNSQTNINPPIHQTNRQQALINGLGGIQQNLGPAKPPQSANIKPLGPVSASSTPKSNSNSATPTNKPLSYADAVGPKSPTPLSPTDPKTPPLSPQPGSPKKDPLPVIGPTSNNDDLQDSQDTHVGGDVTDDELRQFSEMLLRKDTNNAMKYVTLNLQGMTSSRSPNDEAPLPLLKIDPEAYKIPSIEKMMLLYNNYFLDAGQNEVYTGQERIEENNLLDTILATPVMQYARSFLIQKGKIGKDPREFRDLLRLIWFNMYSRGQGRIGSSGFEHIFLAEIKNNQVSGLHNWVFFNEEESQNRANYLGYLKKLDLGVKGAILKYHFTFHDIDKPVGSMFIGTSPELELALYSTCFVLRADKICPLKMNENKFVIRTYTYRYRGKNMIGSAFPEI